MSVVFVVAVAFLACHPRRGSAFAVAVGFAFAFAVAFAVAVAVAFAVAAVLRRHPERSEGSLYLFLFVPFW
jgi:ABC-type spermidine/putrescine transport system permease subunit I